MNTYIFTSNAGITEEVQADSMDEACRIFVIEHLGYDCTDAADDDQE